jgi:thymidylate synthase (FAD)
MKIKFIKPSFEIDMLGETGLEKLKRIEKVARLCYKTEDRITENSHEKLIKMLVDKKHGAMLEFADVAVKFIVSRAFTHELVRHRLSSFAQESQRYVGYGDAMEFIIPPWMSLKPCEFDLDRGWNDTFCVDTQYTWINAMQDSAHHYLECLESGWRPEQARDVLPNACKTEIWIKTNLREWQHVFHLRDSMAAAPQMREQMEPLHIRMGGMIPYIFD